MNKENMNITSKHYNTIDGGYTNWQYKGANIRLDDGTSKYEIMHFVEGIDHNFHRVFWHTDTLEDAIAYVDRCQ